MSIRLKIRWLILLQCQAALVATILVSELMAGPVSTFADIEYWVGDGPNKAALVIDWLDGSSSEPSLVWGYCWDGTATGGDMFEAIAAADARLFAKLGGAPGSSDAAYGIGYDANYDEQFALDDGTTFDDDGLFYTEPSDGVQSIDAEDWYAEGWLLGFWHYGVANTNPFDGGAWASSKFGMADRMLVNGAWDGWTFDPLPFSFSAYPVDPVAAPQTTSVGDYNRDGKLNAADYTVWQDRFGSGVYVPGESADGDASGLIDMADYEIWQSHYLQTTLSGTTPVAATQVAVPEPSTCLVLLAAWIAVAISRGNVLHINRNSRNQRLGAS